MNRGRYRSGFGILELVITLAVAGVLIGGVYQVLVMNQRIESTRQNAWEGPDSIQAALDVLSRELREVSPLEGDLTVLEEHEVAFRSSGTLGIACEVVDAPTPTVRVELAGRPFVAGDRAFVYLPSDPDGAGGWRDASVERVSEGPACSRFAATAQILELAAPEGHPPLSGLAVGSFVRSWTEVRYYVEADDGAPYLVREREGERTILVGPLESSDGLELTYLDREGAPTDDPERVATAGIAVRLRAEAETRGRSARSDSLATVVFLRN